MTIKSDVDMKAIELDGEPEVLRVSGKTDGIRLRDSIMVAFRKKHNHVLRTIGAGTLNTAIKACVNANYELSKTFPMELFLNVKWITIPGDGDVDISGFEITPIYCFEDK